MQPAQVACAKNALLRKVVSYLQGGTNAKYGPAWKGMHSPDTDPATVDRHPSGIMVEDLMREAVKCAPHPLAEALLLIVPAHVQSKQAHVCDVQAVF